MQAAATSDADMAGMSAVASSFCQCEDLTASTCGLAGACSTNHQNFYVKVVVTGTEAHCSITRRCRPGCARSRSKRHDDAGGAMSVSRGQVLAEFAVASLAALMLLLGIIDVGRALYTYHLVSNGARLASRYAIVNGTASCAGGSQDPLQTYVRDSLGDYGKSNMTVTTACRRRQHGLQQTRRPYNWSRLSRFGFRRVYVSFSRAARLA